MDDFKEKVVDAVLHEIKEMFDDKYELVRKFHIHEKSYFGEKEYSKMLNNFFNHYSNITKRKLIKADSWSNDSWSDWIKTNDCDFKDNFSIINYRRFLVKNKKIFSGISPIDFLDLEERIQTTLEECDYSDYYSSSELRFNKNQLSLTDFLEVFDIHDFPTSLKDFKEKYPSILPPQKEKKSKKTP